jgi:hypothetical protein
MELPRWNLGYRIGYQGPNTSIHPFIHPSIVHGESGVLMVHSGPKKKKVHTANSKFQVPTLILEPLGEPASTLVKTTNSGSFSL